MAAIGIGLSMDGLAVSIGSGLSVQEDSLWRMFQTGTIFTLMQIIVLVFGWWLGFLLHSIVSGYAHWIACAILVIVGAKMIKEAFARKKNSSEESIRLNSSRVLALAFATSIDAFAVGAGLGVLKANIFSAAAIVALITFSVTTLGFYIGHSLSSSHKTWTRFIGGALLIVIGWRVLLYHTS